MNTKSILITYASRYGSTQEVAETIATVLRQAGLDVYTQPIQEVTTLDAYDAVVLGAAIYNAKWHPDAHLFLSRHHEILRWLPVAIFTLGPLSTSDAAMLRSRHQLDKELAKYPWLKPVSLQVFAGKYDPTRPGMGIFYKLLPTRDYRDWEAIHAWANKLPLQLEPAEMPQEA